MPRLPRRSREKRTHTHIQGDGRVFSDKYIFAEFASGGKKDEKGKNCINMHKCIKIHRHLHERV